MIEYKNKDLFWEDSIKKDLILSFSGGDVLHNEDVYYESMEITESLCSEQQLKFGTCEASSFKIRIANTFISHINETVEVSIVLNDDTENPFKLGTYKILSDKPTADKVYRDITGYDALYEVLDKNVSDWYTSLLPDENTQVTVKAFRDSLLTFLNIEYTDVSLVNDNAIIKRTINAEDTLTCKDVLNAIGEMNGVFGHINRDNKFTWITLNAMSNNLYPRQDLYPSDNLYPGSPMFVEDYDTANYRSCTYEDFEVKSIEKIIVRESNEDKGTVIGEGTNTYNIQGNFLLFGKDAEQIENIGKNVYNIVKDITYLPAGIEAKGNPCLDVGDGVLLHTKYKDVYTYILTRTIKGIQSLTDKISSKGNEYYEVNNSSFAKQIEQVVSRTRVLSANVDSIKSELTQTQKGVDTLSSTIEQTAEKIETKVSKGGVSSEISQESDKITLKGNRLIVESNNFKLDEDGNAEFSGDITGGTLNIDFGKKSKGDPLKFVVNDYYLMVGSASGEEQGTDSAFYIGTETGETQVVIPTLNTSRVIIDGDIAPTENSNVFIGYGDRPIDTVYAHNLYFTTMYNTNFNKPVCSAGHEVGLYWNGSNMDYWVDTTWKGNWSDARLKKDITAIDDAYINSIGSVDIDQFYMKNKIYAHKLHTGPIAQDLIKAFDENGVNPFDYKLVNTHTEDKDDPTEYYEVDTVEFLMGRIAYDEKRINDLETRLENLERRLENGQNL